MKKLLALVILLTSQLAMAQDWTISGVVKARADGEEAQVYAAKYTMLSHNRFQLTLLALPEAELGSLPAAESHQIDVTTFERGFWLEIIGWGEMGMVGVDFHLLNHEFRMATYSVRTTRYLNKEIVFTFVREPSANR